MKRIVIPLIALAVLIMPALWGQDVYAAEGPNVTSHTQTEISNYIKNSGVTVYDEIQYSTTPVKNTVRGALTSTTKTNALKMLNNIRYIAGLDTVSLDTNYGNLAQAAAFVDYSIDELTHEPDKVTSKPSSMSTTDWNDGINGAGKSNLGWGYGSLNEVVLGWMGDEDSGNISRVGHRRWCLNPPMKKAGFGAAGLYTAMYAFDKSGSGSQTNVAWPARNMPIEYFSTDIPWSLSVGANVNMSNVTVKLTRTRDNKTWNFSGSQSYSTSAAKYFNVDNSNRGQIGCIIFRPDGVGSYEDGDQFKVEITGAKSSTISYTVNFFRVVKLTGIQYSPAEGTVGEGRTINPNINPLPADYEGSLDESKFTYSSSNTSVASVASDGTITGNAPGKAVITATYNGMTAKYTVTVQRAISKLTDGITITNPVYTGQVVHPTYVVKDGSKTLVEGTDYTVKYSDQAIDYDGSFHWIYFYGTGNYYGNLGRSYIVQRKPISEDMVKVSQDTFEYDGASHVPSLTLTYNGMTLKEGTDYTVSRPQNPISKGSYTLTILGKGNYSGSYKVTYTIQAKPLDKSWISLSETEFVYNGETQTPEVTVRSGNTLLTQGTDYKVEYPTSVDAGKYTLTVTGIGQYGGDVEFSYQIAKAGYPPVMPAEDYNVANDVAQLDNSILSDAEGWEFEDSDVGTELVEGETAIFTAVYVGKDANNYQTTRVDVKVTRSACAHANWELRGEAEATCQQEGYTGDKYCLDCGQLIEAGQVIGLADHKPGKPEVLRDIKPTCTEEGVYETQIRCTLCKEILETPKQVLPANGHSWNTKYTIEKEATCTRDGSKCIRCSVCNAVKEGSVKVIPKKGHQWDEGVVTRRATVHAEGEMTYTCQVCGATRTEAIDRLTDPRQQLGEDGTQFGPGASIEALEEGIEEMTSDKDPAGTRYGLLQARSVKQAKRMVKVEWKAVKGADRYIIYGNRCGKGRPLIRQIESEETFAKFYELTDDEGDMTRIAKGKYYKFMVVALDDEDTVISASTIIHAATKGGKVGNNKAVKTDVSDDTLYIDQGDEEHIWAKAVPVSKKLKVKNHRGIAYESSDSSYVSVGSDGYIEANREGTAYIYVYAQNGISAKIKVVVE